MPKTKKGKGTRGRHFLGNEERKKGLVRTCGDGRDNCTTNVLLSQARRSPLPLSEGKGGKEFWQGSGK